MQDAIDPETQPAAPRQRLEMDVGGPPGHGLVHDPLHQPGHRCVRTGPIARATGAAVLPGTRRGQRPVHRAAVAAVGPRHGSFDLGGGGEHGVERTGQQVAEFVEHGVQGIGDGRPQHAVGEGQRQHASAARQFRGHEGQGLGRGPHRPQVGHGHGKLLGQQLQRLVRGEMPGRHQRGHQPAAG